VTVTDPLRLVTVAEAAQALGLTRQGVTHRLRHGKIPGAMKAGRTWLIERSSFEAYLIGGQQGGGAVAPADPQEPAQEAVARLSMLASFPQRNPNPVLRCTVDGAVVYANAAAELLLEALGVGTAGPLTPAPLAVLRQAAATGEVRQCEIEAHERTYLLDFVPLPGATSADIYGRDMTERRRTEEALQLSEERFRTMFDKAAMGLSLARMGDGAYIDVNRIWVRMTGVPREEALGKTSVQLGLNPTPEARAYIMAELAAGHPVTDVEVAMVTKSGERRTVASSVEIVTVAGQKCLLNSLMDITERRRAEDERARLLLEVTAARHEAEQRAAELEAAMETVGHPLAIFDADGRLLRTNASGREQTRYTAEEMALPLDRRLALWLYETWEGETLPPEQNATARALCEGTPVTIRVRMRKGDGPWRWYLHVAAPIRGHNGDVTGAVISMVDVTALREAHVEVERARKQAELRAAQVEAVFAALAEPVIVYKADGTIEQMNQTARRVLGYSDDDMDQPAPTRTHRLRLRRADGVLFPPDQTPAMRALGGETVQGEVMAYDSPSGGTIWASVSAAPVRPPGGGRDGAVAILTDVTELRQTQDYLAQERERLAITLRSIGDGVIVTDAEACVTLMNPAAEAMTGWPEAEAAGRPLDEVFVIFSDRTGEPASSPVARVIETGLVQGLANHTALVSRDGTRRVLADSAAPIRGANGRPVGIVLVFQDVTEQRHLEEERAKVNKLESLGVLAGGIAHDFNNLLTGILGNLVLCELEAGGQPELEELLSESERAATRAKGLTQQLLTFARGGDPVKRQVALPELIEDAASFALRGTRATASFRFAADLWPVGADEGQLAQVIQNLAINANEAMPRGGTVTFSAENAGPEEIAPLPLGPGSYVRVTVTDEGMGIPSELRARIFDPYFTTKPTGSGLGLSVVFSVVVKHDGYVTVDSEPGRGSRFHIYLPATTSAAPPPPTVAEEQAAQGRILLMDDDEIVLRVARRMIERLGCEVDVAREGQQAVDLYLRAMEEGRPFAAVILDLYVPSGLGGQETLARLRRLDPEVRAIVSSGYSGDRVMARYAEFGFAGAIDKPYGLDELRAVIATTVQGELGARLVAGDSRE
jgi:PAS domain S-box-containing protein/excisionase family DNA binding protein